MMGVVSILAMLMSGGTPHAVAPGAEQRPLPGAVDLARQWGVVTSVRRSPERNRAVGGAPNSFHLYGRAIDIARRPGVRHADIDSALRRAGYVLIESLDEGDHSHFAFGRAGSVPSRAAVAPVELAVAEPACPASDPASSSRRRPDRGGECAFTDDPRPRLRPLEAAP